MPVSRLNFFRAAPNQRAGLRARLTEVVTVVAASPGCLGVELLASQDDPDEFVIFERWGSMSDHERAASAIPPAMLTETVAMMAGPARGYYLDPVASA